MSLNALHTLAVNVVFFGVLASGLGLYAWMLLGQFVRGDFDDK